MLCAACGVVLIGDEAAMMAPMPGYAAGMAPVAYAYPPEYAAMPGEQQCSRHICGVSGVSGHTT